MTMVSHGLGCDQGGTIEVPNNITGITATITSNTTLVGTIEGSTLADINDFFRGDNRDLDVVVKDSAGSIVNITGATFKFTVKDKKSDTAFLFQKTTTLATEILITDAPVGEVTVFILPADTSSLSVFNERALFYDLEITTALSKVYTVVEGVINMKEDITTS